MNHPLKERIEKCYLQSRIFWINFDVKQSNMSNWLTGRTKMPEEIEEKITDYIDKLEKLNKEFNLIN